LAFELLSKNPRMFPCEGLGFPKFESKASPYLPTIISSVADGKPSSVGVMLRKLNFCDVSLTVGMQPMVV